MRCSRGWLLLCVFYTVLMPTLSFAGDCVPGDCQYLPDNGTKAACIGALVVGYVIYERSKEKATVRIVAPDDLTIQVCGEEIKFTATTDPTGREDEIQWEVPLDQQQSVSSGQGPEFATSWTETGVKQVVARLNGSADDLILFVFRTPTGGATLSDILNAFPPVTKRGPEDYETYRQHEIPAETTDTVSVEG
jgi:hypothetical protein